MLGKQGGNSKWGRVEMKRRGRIKMEGAQTIFLFCLTQKQKQKQKIEPVQKILYWFKIFVLVQKILYWFKYFVLVQKKLYQRQKLNYNIYSQQCTVSTTSHNIVDLQYTDLFIKYIYMYMY